MACFIAMPYNNDSGVSVLNVPVNNAVITLSHLNGGVQAVQPK